MMPGLTQEMILPGDWFHPLARVRDGVDEVERETNVPWKMGMATTVKFTNSTAINDLRYGKEKIGYFCKWVIRTMWYARHPLPKKLFLRVHAYYG